MPNQNRNYLSISNPKAAEPDPSAAKVEQPLVVRKEKYTINVNQECSKIGNKEYTIFGNKDTQYGIKLCRL